MNRKEWREVSKQSLFFVVFLAGIALLIGGIDLIQGEPFEGEKFIIMLGLWLLTGSLFLGLSPFALDSKQQGLEYLLSLPVSRRRLLLIKLLPRVAALVLFYLVFIALYHLIGGDAFGNAFTMLSLSYFSLFSISFSLALVHENFIVQFIWAGIAWCGYLASCLFIVMLGFSWKFGMPSSWVGTRIWGELSYDRPTLFSAIAVFFVMAMPFIVSFFLAFNQFDLKPIQTFNCRQLLIFVPLLLLAVVASLGLTWALQRNSTSLGTEYFLLEGERLLKADFPGKLTLYDGQGRRRVETGKNLFWEWIHFEAPGKAFLLGYDAGDASMSVIRLSLGDLAWKAVFSEPDRSGPYRSISTPNALFRQSGAELSFLLHETGPGQGSERVELVLLDMVSEVSRKISFRSPAFAACGSVYVLARDDAGDRPFWLACAKEGRERRVFRLWRDGAVDDLGLTRKFPAYYGRLLFCHGPGSLLVRRLTLGGDETVAQFPGNFDIGDDFFVGSMDTAVVREIFGTRNGRLVRVDLEILAVDDLGPARGQVLRAGPADFYYVEHEAWQGERRRPDRWRRVFRLRGRERTLLRQFDFNGKWPANIWMQRNGIVLRDSEERKNSFFAFPDLKKLEFKGVK